MSDKAIYAVLLAGLMVLGYGTFFMPSQQPQQPFPYSQQYAVQEGGYAAAPPAGNVPPECGDINDPKNLQHLSHHPDQFQACYRVVDPAKFRAAVGRDASEFIR